MAGALVLGLGVSPAAAHAVLQRTTPAAGSTLATVPDAVALTFDEPPRAEFSTIFITGPDGQRHDNGPITLTNSVVTEQLAGSRPAGRYVVNWRVISDDGHPVSGQFAFTARAAGVVRPLAMPSKHADNSPLNAGTIVAIAAGVVVFGALFVFLLRRKPAGHDPVVHE